MPLAVALRRRQVDALRLALRAPRAESRGAERAVATAVAVDADAALVVARVLERLRPRPHLTRVPRSRSMTTPKSSWRDWLAAAAVG